jgi:ribosomal protein L7/L12
MIVRLTIQEDGAGFRATISKREDQENTPVGVPEIFLVDDKEEAIKRVKDVARGLGLKTYRVVDKTRKG